MKIYIERNATVSNAERWAPEASFGGPYARCSETSGYKWLHSVRMRRAPALDARPRV